MLLTNNTFFFTLFAGILVELGSSFKEIGEKIKLKTKISKVIGTIILILGWLLIAISLGFSDGKLGIKTLLAFIFSILSVGSIVVKNVLNNEIISKYMFIGSWIGIGIVSGLNRNMIGKVSGIFAAVLVIISKMIILPYQRKNDLVDMPGMNMCNSAWFLLSIANSIINPQNIGLQSLAIN
jgi:hypothetical protein